MVNYLKPLLKDKKGIGLKDMYLAIMILILIGVLLGVGIYTLIKVRVGIQLEHDEFLGDQNVSTGTVTLNSTLSSVYIDEAKITAINTDDGAAITNYTIGEYSGVVTWGGDVTTSGVEANITYKLKYDEFDSEKALTTSIAGIDDFADWIAIIVVVLAAAIILGIVMKSFGGRQPGI